MASSESSKRVIAVRLTAAQWTAFRAAVRPSTIGAEVRAFMLQRAGLPVEPLVRGRVGRPPTGRAHVGTLAPKWRVHMLAKLRQPYGASMAELCDAFPASPKTIRRTLATWEAEDAVGSYLRHDRLHWFAKRACPACGGLDVSIVLETGKLQCRDMKDDAHRAFFKASRPDPAPAPA